MLRIAIIGAGGRVGRLLRPVWPGEARWIGRAGGAGIVAADALARPETMARALDGIDAVVSLAGVTRGDTAALAGNAKLALGVLEAARRAGVGRVLLTSSAAVYGRHPGPNRESALARPATAYGAAKLEMERMAAAWRQAACSDAPEIACLRIGNVAGADALLGNSSAGPREIDVFADGATPLRSYVGPAALARILHRLARSGTGGAGVVNVALDPPVEMGALADAACVDWRPRPAPPAALPAPTLDLSRLARLVPEVAAPVTAADIVADWRAAFGDGAPSRRRNRPGRTARPGAA